MTLEDMPDDLPCIDGFAELDDVVSKKSVREADAAAEKLRSH
mgnify:CR=1 FL=1